VLDVDGRLSPSSAREPLDGIRDAATRAAALTGQLLSFSRRNMTRTRVVDLNDVLRDVQRLLGRVLGAHVATQLELADGPLPVEADTSELEQILLNLAVNARDAMPGGGRLAFSTRAQSVRAGGPSLHPPVPPGEYAVLTVSDTGAGMDGRTRARIFEPFFTTKELGHGTGLGLATVYAIVTRAGGGIDVESEVGRGTTFAIAWPLSPSAAPGPPPKAHEPATPAAAVGHETVWLVEDASDLRALLSDALVQGGYAVREAGHADEALALASSAGAGPQLLVTDVVLPGMNGRQLADILVGRYPDMRVLYLSGYTDDEVLRRGSSGMHFLPKPFALATFTQVVRDILDGQAT
jgi:two-component system, cell cycle sensor histidine kinase and response regulator CckA